jgi:DNA polymerase I-like protein with 3'-5' exonuclease and polymerase domains
MARSYPEVSPIRELRASLSQLHLNELAVGCDGRNRCLLSAYRSRTGRNQPSNSHFVFGPATWLRGLVKPTEGWAVAYCDWSQQEFGIGAALSGDEAMRHAYLSGDPYLTFAMQAGAVPPHATKIGHAAERERFKVCALAVQYGMTAEGLAKKLDDCPARGRELLRLHRETYSTYWRWSDAIRDYAVLSGKLQAVFGWTLNVGQDANPRSLRNFPLQGNGSEMLRIACCLATERGIRVCAPIHDALLVEGPVDSIEEVVGETQRAMQEASEVVLSGFPLRSDATIVRYPDRYSDKRGAKMWDTVQRLIGGSDER